MIWIGERWYSLCSELLRALGIVKQVIHVFTEVGIFLVSR
jgi:hypothetical protein